jgi:hypothetical protein
MRATCHAHLTILYLIVLITTASTTYEAVHYVIFSRLLLLHPLLVQMFSSELIFLKIINPCSPPTVRDQVSQPYAYADKTVFLLNLPVFRSQTKRQKRSNRIVVHIVFIIICTWIILKWMFKKLGITVWTGYNRLRRAGMNTAMKPSGLLEHIEFLFQLSNYQLSKNTLQHTVISCA